MSEEEPVAEITLDSLQKVDVFDGLSTESLLQIKQKMQAKQYSRKCSRSFSPFFDIKAGHTSSKLEIPRPRCSLLLKAKLST